MWLLIPALNFPVQNELFLEVNLRGIQCNFPQIIEMKSLISLDGSVHVNKCTTGNLHRLENASMKFSLAFSYQILSERRLLL